MKNTPEYVKPADSYADLLVWKWHRRGMFWDANYKGARLVVKCVKRPRRGSLWRAEVLTANGYEWTTSGRVHENADLAQQDALELLRRYAL